MTRIKTRKTARGVKARASKPLLVVLPKPQKSWLLAGTALVTGAFGAISLPSSPAQADPTCTASGLPGQEWSCEGPIATAETFTIAESGWLVAFGTPPFTPVTLTNSATINNNVNRSGEFILNVGSTINNAGGNGLIVTNTNLAAASTVTLTLKDNVTASDDSIRVEGGGRVFVNLTASDVTGGAGNSDNGILVNNIVDFVDISIDATSTVDSGDVAILVAKGAVFDSLVAGGVTISNAGVVDSTLDRDVIHVDASGAINITNEITGFLDGGTGVDIHGNNTINVANWGHIESRNAGEGGIIVQNDSASAVTTIRNLATATINTPGDGISANGAGGDIIVFNGDNSDNDPPLPDNPDGKIVAGQEGIDIANANGGNITIFNGLSNTSNSQIFADGLYGIRAVSTGNILGEAGRVTVSNVGLVETEGGGADAGVFASSDNGLGAAIFTNGNALPPVGSPVLNPNARVNAYDQQGGLIPVGGDANGVELFKGTGEGTGQVNLDLGLVGGTSGTFQFFGVSAGVVNDGVWDFTGDDNYLTPGFDGGVPLGLGQTAASTTGGVFAPNGSAVLIRNAGNDLSAIINRGTMIGQGSFFDPVLDIQTNFSATGGDHNAGGTGSGNFALLLNAETGVIGSTNIPSGWPVSLSEAMDIGFGFLDSDTGVDWAFIDDLIESGGLASFADAALDRLAVVTGARLVAQNDGLLVGNVGLFTTPVPVTGQGNFVVNNGAWFTLGFNQFFGGNDHLINNGLIQASFLQDKNSGTFLQGLEQTDNFGVISLLDGGAGDFLDFGGNYFGGFDSNGSGYFALDAFLVGDNEGMGLADEFDINNAVQGSTGLIIRNENLNNSQSANQFGIDVVDYDDGNLSVFRPCSEIGPCAEGDAFFISLLTPNSFALGGGVNGIEDGLYGWYLFQDFEFEDFELRQTLVSPGSLNAPSIITGAQNIWYSGVNVVEDHSYGHQFANSGGGGADLATEPVYEAPAATSGGTRTGLWVKATGSWINQDTTVEELGVDIDTSFDQDIFNVLGGADMKWTPDSPWRIGLFGGYITSSMDFDFGSDSVDYEGGTIGGYLAFNNGAFYADATVKGDLLNADYSFSTVDVDADVTNIGVLANTGYRMHWGGAFFEPIGSLAYVHSEVDDVSTGGATVDFSNGQSFRLGAGARLGTTFATGGGTTELSLLGKVWNEFEDANEVTVTDGINTTTFSDDISGVFGEVSATVVVTDSSGTLSGFLTGGGKFGEDFTSWDAQAGIRKGF